MNSWIWPSYWETASTTDLQNYPHLFWYATLANVWLAEAPRRFCQQYYASLVNNAGRARRTGNPSDFGVCMVGTGAIAQKHMATLDELGIRRRPWVVSRREEVAKDFAKFWNFDRSASDLDKALGDPEVDVVVITSPSPLHVEQATQALEAGKDVIVEIPVGLSHASIERLAGRAKEAGRRIFACHTMRSFPAIRMVREKMLANEFTVTQIDGTFAIPRRRNQGWNGMRSWTDNLLWHHACHQVDASLWLLGMPSIQDPIGMLGRPHPETRMYMDLSLGFLCNDGIPVTHTLTYNCEHILWRIRLVGEEDVLTFQNGKLYDDSGLSLLEPFDIRNLSIQNSDIFHALAAEKPSEFDLSSVVPSYAVLQLVDDCLGWSDD